MAGFNYSFGYKASGTPEILMHEGLRHGFGIHVQEPYMIDGVVVSSTYIRKLIEEGRMEECAKFMGRMYAISGEIVMGNKLGRTIGFPTANMQLYEPLKLVPGNGVYFVRVKTLGREWFGMCNVGCRPTVGEGNARTIETNIFGFDEDI